MNQNYQHFENLNKMIDCYLTNQTNGYQKQNQTFRELSDRRINAYSVASTLQSIYFKYNTVILFETNYFMILKLLVTTYSYEYCVNIACWCFNSIGLDFMKHTY